MEAYLRENPVTFPSYAWRYLQFGAGMVPLRWRARIRDEAGIVEHKQAISRGILQAIHDGLERRGVEHFFLLFCGEAYVDGSKPLDWRETLLVDFLRQNSVPFTSARRAILEDAASSGRTVPEYFEHTDPTKRGHLSAIGNRSAFRALRDGIEGRFEPP